MTGGEVLAKLHSNTKEAIWSDSFVKPLLPRPLDTSTLSKVPQLLLAGMQWLSKTPAVIAAGRFKELVMAAELRQARSCLLPCLHSCMHA